MNIFMGLVKFMFVFYFEHFCGFSAYKCVFYFIWRDYSPANPIEMTVTCKDVFLNQIELKS